MRKIDSIRMYPRSADFTRYAPWHVNLNRVVLRFHGFIYVAHSLFMQILVSFTWMSINHCVLFQLLLSAGFLYHKTLCWLHFRCSHLRFVRVNASFAAQANVGDFMTSDLYNMQALFVLYISSVLVVSRWMVIDCQRYDSSYTQIRVMNFD